MTARKTASTQEKQWFLIHRLHAILHDLLDLDPQDIELNPGVSGEGDS